MNRYRYLIADTQNSNKFIGLFPWGILIDSALTDHKKNEIHFTDAGVDFLKALAAKNISVVLFMNQFKPHVLSYEKLGEFVSSVEGFVKSQGVNSIGMYWCPGIDQKDPFVVPNPGMFVRVTENIGVDWKDIPVLSAGDADLSAASKVKATPIKIGSVHKKYQSFDSLANWLASI
jgi:histidinol phosphatase-like enzyme